VREGWENKPLGEIVEFQRGLTYSKGDEVDSSSNVVLRANNIDLASHALDFSELKYIRDDIEIPASKKLKRGRRGQRKAKMMSRRKGRRKSRSNLPTARNVSFSI
jgi:hypothetical protein